MKTVITTYLLKRSLLRGAAWIACLTCFAAARVAYCDSPINMAPPVSQDGSSVDPSTVFNWSEVPQNQQVTINRAVFDQGGYQLYDSVGETIVVPFVNNNLYVMKFAKSPNGLMFFVNAGDAPILYVPKGGYLENATVPGAVWHPFTSKFHPADPVFLGIAPSWNAFIAMGWYPDMVCHGGYWSSGAYGSGLFVVTDGFLLEIGSYTINDWHHYHLYWQQYGAPYRTAYFDRNIYAPRNYNGGHGSFGHGGGAPVFRGAPGGAFGGGSNSHGGHTFSGAGTTSGGSHSFLGGGRTTGGGHTFLGGQGSSNSGGNHGTPGNASSGSTNSGSQTFQGGSGGSPSGGSHSSGSSAPGSGAGAGGGHTFLGGGAHSPGTATSGASGNGGGNHSNNRDNGNGDNGSGGNGGGGNGNHH